MKNYFRLFLACSCCFHLIAFSLFFRVIQEPADDVFREKDSGTIDRELSDEEFLDYDIFESVLAPFMDTAIIESLWQTDSLSLKKWSAFSPSDKKIFNTGWYQNAHERSLDMQKLLEKYRLTPGVDSLLAQSEFLRQALQKQILEHFDDNLKRGLPNDLDWKKFLTELADSLKKSFGSFQEGAGKNQQQLSRMLIDPELMKLWKEAMHFSLQEEARERMSEALREALSHCLSQCGEGGSGKGGKEDLALPGSGTGGAFIGNGEIGAEDFEQCLIEALQAIGGSGLSLMGSLFKRDELYEQLGKEARAMALSTVRGNALAGSFLGEVDFKKAIEKALAGGGTPGGGTPGGESMQRVAEFLATIKKGLGEDIAEWFALGPSQSDLRKNPYYYAKWARGYLDLINSIIAAPNLLMPNIGKYAEAAKNIRERYLSTETKLALGKGDVLPVHKKTFNIPRQVYLPANIAKKDLTPSHTPLIKRSAFMHAWGGAARAVQPIKLDGRLNEWQQCRPYVLCGSGQGLRELPPKLRNCCLRVQWDNRGLYFAYQIQDTRDNPHNVANFWDTDALEIFLDPHNHKDSHRTKGRSFQFWAWPRARGNPGSTGQSVFPSPNDFDPKVLKEGFIRFASVRKQGQYTAEVFIPGLLLEKWYPLPGKIIGFNYSINNGEGIFIRWVTNSGRNISFSPDLWGDLLLMGSDANIEVSPDDFILPDQIVKITVTDHDMNLKPQIKDKIWVTMKSRLTDDKLPVVLMETGNNTGVFLAELGTVFALKAKEKERISVRPGDLLEIYYLDQHGSGGKKDVARVREINVGRGVFSFGK